MTNPQPLPCFGGPLDGKNAPQWVERDFFDIAYPIEGFDRPYSHGVVEIDTKINRGRYTLKRFVRREWSERYPTEQEMQEWEEATAEWEKPIGELSFLGLAAREMYGNLGPPPMPRKRYIVRDRTASAFCWEVAVNGQKMLPEWGQRIRFVDDPPWQIDREREAKEGVARERNWDCFKERDDAQTNP
jgi:hypothetical protein